MDARVSLWALVESCGGIREKTSYSPEQWAVKGQALVGRNSDPELRTGGSVLGEENDSWEGGGDDEEGGGRKIGVRV